MSKIGFNRIRASLQYHLQNAPITRKLLIIVMTPTLAALVLACGLLFLFTATFIRQWMLSEVDSFARMTSKQLDRDGAYQVRMGPQGNHTGHWLPRRAVSTLNLLESSPIFAAALYDQNGNRVATYFRDRTPVPLPDTPPDFIGADQHGAVLEFNHPIEAISDPERPELLTVGFLYLRADATYARGRIALFGVAVLLIIALSAVLAYLLSERMQRIISGPITHLSLLTHTISDERDYSLRAVKTGDDEIGELVDGFNTMLDRIEEHRLALQEAHDKLEDRVQERTEELQRETLEHKETAADLKRAVKIRDNTEKELKRATVAAEAASRAKGDFVAQVSHEIRTPMNGILGMTELLRGTALSSPQKRYLDTIRRSGSALLDIIGDVLDYSKIEAGQIEISDVPFDLHAVCEDVVDLLSPRAQEKGVAMFLRYAPRTPRRLVGDPKRLSQVLTNLTANALKFTDTGHVVIDVSGKAIDEGKLRLRIYVEDTGIGASREKIHRIFGEYIQADADVERQYGGTGLGLSIAKDLMELMGGDISVQSREGVGSRFICKLNLRLDRRPDTVLTNNPLQGVVVGIIDANAVRGAATVQSLEAWGMQAEHWDNAEAACADPPGEDAFVLVEDQGLDMDAATCAEALREHNCTATLIVLPCRAEQGHAAKLHRAGYAGYLSRPFRESELRLVLERTVTQREAGTLVTRYDSDVPPGQVSEVEMFCATASVLVVDDSEVNREVAKEMLTGFGCKVVEAEDGTGAVERVEAGEEFDLILMDCQMTRMDGYEATMRIREFEHGDSHIPIIAVTAMAMMGDKKRCLDAGMDDYLLKPFNPEKLVNHLKRWLPKDKRSYRDAPAKPASEVTGQSEIPSEISDQPLDLARALWVTGGNRELFYKAAKIFMKHMPDRFVSLREAVTQRDSEEVARLAHSIKGASASVGGEQLRAAALGLECAGREASYAEFADRFATMDACYKALEEALLAQLPSDEEPAETKGP